MRKLMDIHGIPLNGRPLLAYHDHNGEKVRPKVMQYLEEGKSVAYGSEAGTPNDCRSWVSLGKTSCGCGGIW